MIQTLVAVVGEILAHVPDEFGDRFYGRRLTLVGFRGGAYLFDPDQVFAVPYEMRLMGSALTDQARADLLGFGSLVVRDKPSLSHFTASTEADSQPLTLETLEAAIEKIRDMPVRICGVTEPHVLHPRALKVDGVHWCMNCGTPVTMAGGQVVRP